MQKEVTLDGIVYVPKNQYTTSSEVDGMKYCIVRARSAGVFAGYLESRNGQEAVIQHARRLWYLDGAASILQLAMSGTSKPNQCNFSMEVNRITVMEVIEIIECTVAGMESIRGVKV